MPYAVIAKGDPWFMPSLLCKKLPDPYFELCTTRVYQ